MSVVLSWERTIQTWTEDVFVEGFLIDSLVDAGATFVAFEVAFSLLKAALILAWGLKLLVGFLSGWGASGPGAGQAWSAWSCVHCSASLASRTSVVRP